MNARTGANEGAGNGSVPRQSTRELLEQSQRVREDVAALAGTVRQVTRGWEALLRDRLEQRPYATLAVAAGVGYVLGGGVPSGIVRLLLGIGSRLAVEQAIAHFTVPQSEES
jgi:phage shock protein A